MPESKIKAQDVTTKKKINPNSKVVVIATTILGAITISLIAYFFVVSPQFARVGHGREFDVDSITKTIEERQAYFSQLKDLKVNLENISGDDIDIVSRVLPGSKAVPELFSQLEAIARQSGVSMVSINLSEVKDDAPQSVKQRLQSEVASNTGVKKSLVDIKELNIQMEIAAFSYNSYKTFLDAVQSHVRLIDVSRYEYSADNDVHSLTATVYYLEN